MVQWSWFAQVNALCNLSRKKSREVAASLPGQFLSRHYFTLCITMELNLELWSSTHVFHGLLPAQSRIRKHLCHGLLLLQFVEWREKKNPHTFRGLLPAQSRFGKTPLSWPNALTMCRMEKKKHAWNLHVSWSTTCTKQNWKNTCVMVHCSHNV